MEKQEERLMTANFSICIAPNGGQLMLEGTNGHLHDKNHETQTIDCSDMNWSDQYRVKLSGLQVT